MQPRLGNLFQRLRPGEALRALIRNGDAVCIPLRPAVIDLYIATLDPAEIMEGRLKRLYAFLPFGVVRNRHQHAHAPHALALLRARCERPRGRRTSEQVDEIAPGAVGTRVTSCPPLRSVHAAFPHTAPTSGV